MTVSPARHRKGAPAGAGGQFTATAKGESGGGLLEESAAAIQARDRLASIRQELVGLVRDAPEAVYSLAEEAIRLVTHEATPPALLLRGQGEGGAQRDLIDPFTGRPTELIAVESASRWTNTRDYDSEGGEISLAYGSTEGDFETIGYRSSSSGRFLALPDGWEETYA